jgi:integrase
MPKAQTGVYERGRRGGRHQTTQPVQWVAVADLGWKNGKRDRHEFTAATMAAAERKRDDFLARRRDGFTLPKGRQPTVSEWVQWWLHNIAKPKIDPNTFYRSYRQKCEDWIVPYFERVKLAELTEEDIEGWHRQLEAATSRRGTPLSASTITTIHRIFSACLNVAVARRRLPHNPCTLVHPPKADREAPEPPTADELDAILAACADWPDGARWVLAICTGLRQGEALGLRWRDVRLSPPASITIRQSLARIGGESVMKAPKSAKSRRTIPLPARAVAAMKAHREAQEVADISGLVFPGRTDREDWIDWDDLLSSLSLPHYRVHDARHAFATTMLEAGADPRLVQDLMGHSDARMLEIYQHVRPVMHEQARSMLDQRFGGG